MNDGETFGKALRASLIKSLFGWVPCVRIGSWNGLVGDGSSSKSIITTSSLEAEVLVVGVVFADVDKVFRRAEGKVCPNCVTGTPARTKEARGMGRCATGEG